MGGERAAVAGQADEGFRLGQLGRRAVSAFWLVGALVATDREPASGLTSLAELAQQAATCTRCDCTGTSPDSLPRGSTGRPADASLRAAGDAEDKQGKPFVGPAGRLLDRALLESGISRSDAYLTNAVKTSGSPERQAQAAPAANRTQIVACRPWLEAELACLPRRPGRSAPSRRLWSALGSGIRHRGGTEETAVGSGAALVLGTIHRSAVLRAARRVRTSQRVRRAWSTTGGVRAMPVRRKCRRPTRWRAG